MLRMTSLLNRLGSSLTRAAPTIHQQLCPTRVTWCLLPSIPNPGICLRDHTPLDQEQSPWHVCSSLRWNLTNLQIEQEDRRRWSRRCDTLRSPCAPLSGIIRSVTFNTGITWPWSYITMGGCTTIQRYPLLTLLHELNNAKLSTLTRMLWLLPCFAILEIYSNLYHFVSILTTGFLT